MSQVKKTFNTNQYTASYSIESRHEAMRLDSFIQIYYPQFSREFVKKKIKQGEIQISNRPFPHRPSTKIHEGEKIKVIINKTTHEDEYWKGEKIKLINDPEVIYEDENLIAISKPPFMSTHPTGKHLFYCATVYFEAKYKHTIHSVHRLDRETSGILLLTKNPKTAQELTHSFENGLIKKCYFFIAHNKDFNHVKEFTCNLRLGSRGDDLRSRVVTDSFPETSTEGKRAKTNFKILHEESNFVLGLAFPHTGRQHQIRVHAQQAGLPLLGDKLYHGGYKMFQNFKDGVATEEEFELMQIPRHALHALGIITTYKKKQEIISSIPDDFAIWITNNLNIDVNKVDDLIQQELSDWKNIYSSK